MYLMDTSLRLCMRWKQEGRDGIVAGSSPLYTHIYVTTVYVLGRYILLITKLRFLIFCCFFLFVGFFPSFTRVPKSIAHYHCLNKRRIEARSDKPSPTQFTVCSGL